MKCLYEAHVLCPRFLMKTQAKVTVSSLALDSLGNTIHLFYVASPNVAKASVDTAANIGTFILITFTIK